MRSERWMATFSSIQPEVSRLEGSKMYPNKRSLSPVVLV
jgi:hypothetical protein